MGHRKNLILFTLLVSNLVDQPAPEVTIEQGVLSGKLSTSGMFYEYIGIPYATTNSSTRFKAPGAPPSWEGVYKAVDEIYFCPQPVYIGYIGVEDCLKINVYVPTMAKPPFPVMVYIHGGTFIVGGGGKLVYGPDYLIEKDVIVVTFNYRLGALGFLCLGIKEAPGNAGLKDQITALRWVKKNIAAFGGDPDNITLFGESAGATSTALLLASNATLGLFNRAIVQSGPALSNWVINKNPVQVARLLAKALGYSADSRLDLYKIFSKLSIRELVGTNVRIPSLKYLDTQLMHLPCVEENIDGEEAVLTDLPYNLFNKKSKSVPVIYGFTSNEGLFLISEYRSDMYENRNKFYMFASDLSFKRENDAANESQKIRTFYFGNDDISTKNMRNLSDMYTHLYFEMPSLFESKLLIERTNTTVYNYYFDYSGSRSFMKMRSGYVNENGACHGDDLFYIFKALFLPVTLFQRDQKMIDTMTTLWTNFAKYGEPTPDETELQVKWMPSNKHQMNFLYINDDLKMGKMPNPKPYQLWKTLYDKYRKLSI
ncbi:PREDICTED: esterase FE4-like [Papilio xuthus]|uniref:Carboxylic ester hydrolase n=1 Tax=Papilio xuthus TaxID=66420 RepID=A0AAJ7EI73_PAPXU|nr:PREDICTED: esterase FE4-like [Papilio xuthus]